MAAFQGKFVNFMKLFVLYEPLTLTFPSCVKPQTAEVEALRQQKSKLSEIKRASPPGISNTNRSPLDCCAHTSPVGGGSHHQRKQLEE